jgi:lipid-binding SYLF domain-containing protein
VKTKLVLLALCVLAPCFLFAQKKEDERLANSATAMRAIFEHDGLPTSILNNAVCVVVFPSVKNVAIGIGGSYGRGVLVCRKGLKRDGSWGAPAMYKLDQGSVGVQLGSTATDFVLVVMNERGAEQILNGKIKLGGNAAAAAGPTGAAANGYNANALKVDVLTYSRTKGLFAGVSLEGASMDTDDDANKAVYGKSITAKQIIAGDEATPPAGKALVELLNKESPGSEGGTEGVTEKEH